MDRQTARQQTGSEVRAPSGKPKRLQTRSGHSSRPATPLQASQARSQSSSSRPPQSHPRRKRSPRWILFVFGLWAVLLIAAVLAARSLLDPTVSLPSPAGVALSPPLTRKPTPAAQPALPGAALDNSDFYQSSEAEQLPIVALGSIALSCAMGCILVSRVLHPRRSPPQLQSRSRKSIAAKSIAPQQPLQLPPATEPVVQPFPVQSALVIDKGVVQEMSVQETPHPQAAESATPAIVTVLSSDQSLPLDWDEPSLADSLDLRQRPSLLS